MSDQKTDGDHTDLFPAEAGPAEAGLAQAETARALSGAGFNREEAAVSAAHRRPVPLAKCYRLLNHGPTVLVSAAHNGQRNIMAAAWAMPLDFQPPKVTVVLDKSVWTRQLLEGSGTFVINVPTISQLDIVETVGSTSGLSISQEPDLDKFKAYGLQTFEGAAVDAPLLEGCAGWLECRLIPEPHNQSQYDLFIGEVVAAWADERVFSEGHWHFQGHDALRTIHHVAGGHFLVIGDGVDGKVLERQGS